MRVKLLIIPLLFTMALVLQIKPVLAQQYDKYIWNVPTPVPITAEKETVRDELVQEVQKIVDAGHLAPAKFVTGDRTGGQAILFWAKQAEIIATLSTAYPYLPADLQAKVKTYLDQEIANYPPHQQGGFPGNTGTKREWFPTTPNLSVNIWPPINPSIEDLYPLWLYSYTTDDWTYVQNNFSSLSTIYNNFKSTDNLNSYLKVAGVIGYARIGQHLTRNTEAQDAATLATNGLTNGLNFNQFVQTGKQKFSVIYSTPPFLYGQVTPLGGLLAGYFPREIGQFLKDNTLSSVQSYVQEISEDVPYWYLTNAGWGIDSRLPPVIGNGYYLGEDVYLTPEVAWTNFMLRAYVLGEDSNTMKNYLDFPSRKGDLFHIQKLVAALEAAPTVSSPLTGDINQDTQVNVLDIQACVNHILGLQDLGGRGDVNGDSGVDVLDVQVIVNIILGDRNETS